MKFLRKILQSIKKWLGSHNRKQALEVGGPGNNPHGVNKSETPVQSSDESGGEVTSVSSSDTANSSQPPDREPISNGCTKSGKEPRKISGRRKKPPGMNTHKRDRKSRESKRPKPELICRQDTRANQWQIMLSVDDECDVVGVYCDDSEPLPIRDGEYFLSSLTGKLVIKFENDQDTEIELFNEKPLFFKFTGENWEGDGVGVTTITKGSYIVIAPENWTRLGHVPVERDACMDNDFLAHYFFWGRDASREDVGFKEYKISTKPGIKLIGETVFDDSDRGDLFVCMPPKLERSENFVWARIGEEASGGWRGENFRPLEKSLADILNHRQGRFFIRVYDGKPRLLDSGEFRYFCNLKDIQIDGKPYSSDTLLLPPPSGYAPAKVQFISADNTTLRIKSVNSTYATVESDSVMVITPRPEGDELSCTLSDEKEENSVDVTIKLPRFWWQIKSDGKESDEWRDTPLTMTRQEYREYADAAAKIRLRLPTRVQSVNVGFDEELDRTYHRRKEEGGITLPFKTFVDYTQVDQRLKEEVAINVKCNQCGGSVLTLLRISADPIPAIIFFTSEPEFINPGQEATIRWSTQHTEPRGIFMGPEIGPVEPHGSITISPASTMTFTLRLQVSGMEDVTKSLKLAVGSLTLEAGEKLYAQVKCRNGCCRQGKGFSCGEIAAAGPTASDIKRLSVRLDRRRKSAHTVNIEALKSLINA